MMTNKKLFKSFFTTLAITLCASMTMMAQPGSAMEMQAPDKKCLYISSYHSGYEWSDSIEEGLEASIKGICTLDKFYMDTKRNTSKEFKEKMGLAAKEHVETTEPDVVIACDDNASKYVVMPYFRDKETPFVFCGVNYNVDAYEYPYSNVTGMIEIAPVKPTVEIVKEILPDVKKGVYLSMDIVSQHKEYNMNKGIYADAGIELERILITNLDEWKEGFTKAQSYPFVIVGSSGGIKNWNMDAAKEHVAGQTKTLTVTNMDWMYEVSMVTVTKIAQEQGEWSAEVAKAILEGTTPEDIPIVVNRRWNLRINPELIEKTDIKIPQNIRQKAIREN